MSLLDRTLIIPRQRKSDSRGWFLKVIDGREEKLPQATGEVYLTMAEPGQVRGNHYHLRTAEWFTVVIGKAQLLLCDPATGESRELLLDAATPQTVYVPPGVAHAFKNPAGSGGLMLLVAYASELYEADDTVPLNLLLHETQDE